MKQRKIDEKVQMIYQEYEKLSKTQRDALFSQPTSVNLLVNYQGNKQQYRQPLNKKDIHQKNGQFRNFKIGQKNPYRQFSDAVYNTIYDTYQDPFKLGKYNYQNNQFRERKRVKPWSCMKKTEKYFKDYNYIDPYKDTSKNTKGFGMKFQEEKDDGNFTNWQTTNEEQTQQGAQRQSHRRQFTQSANEQIQSKQVFKISKIKTQTFSEFPYKPTTQQNKRQKPKSQQFLNGDFKMGSANYVKPNQFLENLKYEVERQKRTNQDCQLKENKIWKPNGDSSRWRYNMLQKGFKYIPNGSKPQKRKTVDNIWKHNQIMSKTRACPSIMLRIQLIQFLFEYQIIYLVVLTHHSFLSILLKIFESHLVLFLYYFQHLRWEYHNPNFLQRQQSTQLYQENQIRINQKALRYRILKFRILVILQQFQQQLPQPQEMPIKQRRNFIFSLTD